MVRAGSRLGVEAALVSGVLVRGDVSVSGGRVVDVGLDTAPGASGTAVPGFVDWQVNGFGGVHFTGTDLGGFGRASDALSAAGVVWAAPVVLNTTLDGYVRTLSLLGQFLAEEPGAGLLGAHLEGPNLADEFHGAHDPGNFLDGDPSLVARLTAAGPVALVTLAPERAGVMDMVDGWVSAGVAVSVGHSAADASTCTEAMARGASAITHCWNAHRRFTSRDPGPAGWALTTDGVTVGLIADGVHVAPEVLALSFNSAAGRIALTTDAIAPAGIHAGPHPGRSDLLGPITVADGAARLPDGTLAGSVATPSQMIRVLMDAGMGFADVIHSLSVPQSGVLGLPENFLRPGDPADVTVLDDHHDVLHTWRAGRCVF